MKFMLNFVRNEIIFLKKIISASKINDWDRACERIKLMAFDVDILKDKITFAPKIKDIDDLQSQINQRITIEEFKDLQKEVDQCVT